MGGPPQGGAPVSSVSCTGVAGASGVLVSSPCSYAIICHSAIVILGYLLNRTEVESLGYSGLPS